MSSLREAAQQALEALENAEDQLAKPYSTDASKAITALRAALAQQAEPVEPRRWEGDHNVESPFNACMHKSYCITLKQALAQQAEPWERRVALAEQLQMQQAEPQSVAQRFNAAFSRHAATRGDAVLIERRDGRLYMNDSEIGPGTLEIREDGVTYRSAALVDVRKPEQAEPVLQTCNCRWDGEVQVQQCTLHEAHVDAIHEWAERAKVAERKLAQQAEPECPDCRGIGYDASGQLCGCQDKPSPCAYPNCVGGQAGTICKPSCPGGTK